MRYNGEIILYGESGSKWEETAGWAFRIAKGFNLSIEREFTWNNLDEAYEAFFTRNADYDLPKMESLLSFVWKNRYVNLMISYKNKELSVKGKDIFGGKIEWVAKVDEKFAALFLPEAKTEYQSSLEISERDIETAKSFANWLYEYAKLITNQEYHQFVKNVLTETIKIIKNEKFKGLSIKGGYDS